MPAAAVTAAEVAGAAAIPQAAGCQDSGSGGCRGGSGGGRGRSVTMSPRAYCSNWVIQGSGVAIASL